MYNSLFLFSQDFDFLPHRANIVSMVMSRGQPSAAGPVYDTKLQCCYHMVLLEPRVTMVGVVNQYRRREKDSAIITALNGKWLLGTLEVQVGLFRSAVGG